MLNNIYSFITTHTPLFYLTQPIWRDEAFAVLISKNSPVEIIKLSTLDFNPPLYFLLLHFWIKIFGYSEIAVRSLSFIFHASTVALVYKFSQYIAKKFQISNSQFPISTAVLAALNPMLLYYAFEARTYSLLALLAVISMYSFFSNRRLLYIITNTLGLYSHYYFVLVILTQIIFFIIMIIKKMNFQFSIFNFQFPVLFFLPWIPTIIRQIQASSETWRYPADSQVWLASLGNLYTGFSGNPPNLWFLFKIMTFIILVISLIVVKRKFNISLLFFLWMIIPTLTILMASFAVPLWVNRYLIFVAVAETMLIALFITLLPKNIYKASLSFLACFLIILNLWLPKYKKKVDYRLALTKLKQNLTPDDLLVATDPIHFFETKYYLLDTQNPVKLYYPANKHIPQYLGTAIIKKSDIISKLPSDRAIYLIDKDASITEISN